MPQMIRWDDFHPEMNLFDALSENEFRKLLTISRRKTVEAGSALLREGRYGDTLFIILDGKVKVYKDGDQQQPIEIAILGSGSVFGEMAVFDNQPNSASVLTVEDTILLEIDRTQLFEFLQKNPKTGFAIMHTLIYVLSSRLRKANVHASSMASTNPELADTLNNLLKN